MFNIDLDSKCKTVLDQLMANEEYTPVLKIALDNDISRRSAYNTLYKINDFLKINQIEPIVFDRSNGVLLSSTQKENIIRLLEGEQERVFHIFSPMERVDIIICTLIISKKKIFIEDIMDICQVSRSTVISDLKITNKKLHDFNLDLNYINKQGYQLKGNIIKKRAAFFLLFSELYEYYYSGAILVESKKEVLHYLTKLTHIEEKLETRYVEGTLLMLAIFLPSLIHTKEHILFNEQDKITIVQSREYLLSCEEFPFLEEEERQYLALHLLGSRLQTTPITFVEDEKDFEIQTIASSFVSEFCRIACIEIENLESIERSLFFHLKTSLYRYRYGIQLGNPMLNDIKNQYPELFDITKKACEYLNKEIGFPINDSEIAYLTLHFSGLINLTKNESSDMNILIVCPNGISTRNLLKSEIALLVPQATGIDLAVSDDIYNIEHEYDVIISTIKVESEKKSILVHPILTDNDRFLILKKCMKHEMSPKIEIHGIMSIIKKHIPSTDLSELEMELSKYLEIRNPLTYTASRNTYRGLMDYLMPEYISYVDKQVEWKDAIQLSGEALCRHNYISEDYVKAIITLIEEFGDYMFLHEHVIVAHAKIDDGVNKIGLSVGVFPNGVVFPEHKNANIIFVLAAEDQNKHLKILKDLMKIFMTDNFLERLLCCDTKTAFMEQINTILKS